MYLSDFHATVQCLTHIIYGKERHTDACHGLHLYTCFAYTGCRAKCRDAACFFIQLKLNITLCHGNRMTERNKHGIVLCSHDSRNSSHSKHITLFSCARRYCPVYSIIYLYRAAGLRHAVGVILCVHIHHVSLPCLIKVCELFCILFLIIDL